MSKVVQIITIFISERKKVFFLTLFVFIFAIVIMIFWIVSYYYVYMLSDTLSYIAIGFWSGYGVYWTFWFYYSIVYLIGAQTTLWFYNSQKSSIRTSIKWFLNNLGTVTYGALILIFIKIADFLTFIFCSNHNCIYLKLMNNYNMTVCSITSQSYSVSLKLTGYIFIKNY